MQQLEQLSSSLGTFCSPHMLLYAAAVARVTGASLSDSSLCQLMCNGVMPRAAWAVSSKVGCVFMCQSQCAIVCCDMLDINVPVGSQPLLHVVDGFGVHAVCARVWMCSRRRNMCIAAALPCSLAHAVCVYPPLQVDASWAWGQPQYLQQLRTLLQSAELLSALPNGTSMGMAITYALKVSALFGCQPTRPFLLPALLICHLILVYLCRAHVCNPPLLTDAMVMCCQLHVLLPAHPGPTCLPIAQDMHARPSIFRLPSSIVLHAVWHHEGAIGSQ